MPLPEAMTSAWTEDAGFIRLNKDALRCCFTTRAWGDMRYCRRRQEALVKACAPQADARLLRQVHGKGIAILRRGAPDGNALPDAVRDGALPRADGWITDRPGAVVVVVVADCLPVWIWERTGKAAGVFHAGWRGLDAGLLGAGVAEFSRSFGIRPGDLEASVGPHAGACCYRVGPEVAQRFRPESRRLRGGEVFLDLGAEARAQLVGAGLGPGAVAVSPDCTICRASLFYSFRREGGRGPRAGQMLACLWLAEA